MLIPSVHSALCFFSRAFRALMALAWGLLMNSFFATRALNEHEAGRRQMRVTPRIRSSSRGRFLFSFSKRRIARRAFCNLCELYKEALSKGNATRVAVVDYEPRELFRAGHQNTIVAGSVKRNQIVNIVANSIIAARSCLPSRQGERPL